MHPRRFHSLRIFLLLISFLLTACGGGSSSQDANTPNLAISGSLGQLRNVTARILDLNLNEIVDPVEIGSDGIARFQIDSATGPFVVEIAGDGDAEYYDEAEEAFRPFGVGFKIRAIVPSFQSAIGVTTLTEIAVAQLEAQMGGLTAATPATIAGANTAIRDLLAPALPDITTPPTIVGPTTGDLTTSTADFYGVYLAGLAELGGSGVTTEPALQVMLQLSEDLQDGLFDGLNAGQPLINELYPIDADSFVNPNTGTFSVFESALIIAANRLKDANISTQDFIEAFRGTVIAGLPIAAIDVRYIRFEVNVGFPNTYIYEIDIAAEVTAPGDTLSVQINGTNSGSLSSTTGNTNVTETAPGSGIWDITFAPADPNNPSVTDVLELRIREGTAFQLDLIATSNGNPFSFSTTVSSATWIDGT